MKLLLPMNRLITSGAANDTSEPEVVTITVTGTNDRPIAEVVTGAAVEGGSAITGEFTAFDLDSTDSHYFEILSQPDEGTVINNEDGTFSFDPGIEFQDLGEGETREVTFTYAAIDDSGANNNTSETQTVTITVTGINNQPVADVVSISATDGGSAVTGNFGVIDTDDSDAHTFAVLSQPSQGTVLNNNDGTFSFDPGTDFADLADGESREVTFTYHAVDDSGAANAASEPQTVTILVSGSNSQPVAEVVSVSAQENGGLAIGEFVVTDVDTSNTHSFNILSQPDEGAVINNGDGSFSFDPGNDFQELAEGETREVTFTYEAVDDSGAENATSEPKSVTVTVTGTNDQPVCC